MSQEGHFLGMLSLLEERSSQPRGLARAERREGAISGRAVGTRHGVLAHRHLRPRLVPCLLPPLAHPLLDRRKVRDQRHPGGYSHAQLAAKMEVGHDGDLDDQLLACAECIQPRVSRVVDRGESRGMRLATLGRVMEAIMLTAEVPTGTRLWASTEHRRNEHAGAGCAQGEEGS